MSRPVKTSETEIYNEIIPWELPIQICAADILGPESIALDIGGNVGGVAIALSRLVDHGGHVYTFEPNPDMQSRLMGNIKANNVNNLTLVPLACFSESGKLMKFWSGPSYYKAESGLINAVPGATEYEVMTISVDDFCCKNEITPEFAKIDVEGAEIQVLRSMRQIIDSTKLALIIEYQPHSSPDLNEDPLIFLSNLGYLFFDTNSYLPVDAEIYSMASGSPRVNVLCLHRESRLANSYVGLKKECVYKQIVDEPEVLGLKNIQLPTGRYVVEIDFDAPDNVVGGLEITSNKVRLAYYEADTNSLAHHSCSNMVIDLKNPVSICVEFVPKDIYVAGLKMVTISRIVFPGPNL